MGGPQPGVHVTELRAPDSDSWDLWPTIRRANPMVNANPSLRQAILRERDEARRNPTMRRSFEAFRLNRSVEVTSEVLVEAEDWLRVLRRWHMNVVLPMARLLEDELSAKLEGECRLVFDGYALDMVSRATGVDKLVRAGVPTATALSAVGLEDE